MRVHVVRHVHPSLLPVTDLPPLPNHPLIYFHVSVYNNEIVRAAYRSTGGSPRGYTTLSLSPASISLPVDSPRAVRPPAL